MTFGYFTPCLLFFIRLYANTTSCPLLLLLSLPTSLTLCLSLSPCGSVSGTCCSVPTLSHIQSSPTSTSHANYHNMIPCNCYCSLSISGQCIPMTLNNKKTPGQRLHSHRLHFNCMLFLPQCSWPSVIHPFSCRQRPLQSPCDVPLTHSLTCAHSPSTRMHLCLPMGGER